VIVVSAVAEAPVLGNHWLIAALASLAYLASGARLPAAEPGLRLVLLAAYAFAAFAKLNEGFLDPVVSCAVVYADQTSRSLLGPGIVPGSAAATAVVAGTVLVEASIPVLLVIRRARPFGVALGMGFHTLISFDLSQHFYDFTAVLIALFLLFLPPSFALGLATRAGRLRRGDLGAATGVAVALVLVILAGSDPRAVALVPLVAFPAWAVYSLGLLIPVLAGLRRPASMTAALSWRPAPLSAVVVALAVVNGVLPYLGVKTAYAYTMYSNLVVSGGATTHLVVPGSVQLRREDVVEVVRSDDPRLQVYATNGWALPMPNVIAFAVANPDARAQVSISGGPPRDVRIGELVPAAVPRWWAWAPLRAVDTQRPGRCQTGFLPAL
jgi:hypothetical protein